MLCCNAAAFPADLFINPSSPFRSSPTTSDLHIKRLSRTSNLSDDVSAASKITPKLVKYSGLILKGRTERQTDRL